MFPSVVSLSEKDKSNNINSDCHFSTNALNFGVQIQHLATSLNPNFVISCDTINSPQEPSKIKRKRNLPGNPDPDAEVIALSPKTLLATNRFVCEVCQKGFQRDQNLQLHRRGHNLPWKLKQRNSKEIRKRAYVCPEPTCVHHHPSRALGDLTGIKKHFCRKHGEKKWKCEKCSKIYAVQSDWKAHSKTCGTREYKCDCGIIFSRKDSFITHRAFCDALAEETARISASNSLNHHPPPPKPPHHHIQTLPPLFPFPPPQPPPHHNPFPQNPNPIWDPIGIKSETLHLPILPQPPYYQPPPPAHLSATALLQKAAAFGSHPVGHVSSSMAGSGGVPSEFATWQKRDHLTRDFMGLAGGDCGDGAFDANVHVRDMIAFRGVNTMVKSQRGFGFEAEPTWR